MIIGGGVAGYVAAIKAGQEGMKVHIFPSLNIPHSMYTFTYTRVGSMHRKAWSPGWNVSQCWLYTVKIIAQQLAPIPSDPSRYKEARHRSW